MKIPHSSILRKPPTSMGQNRLAGGKELCVLACDQGGELTLNARSGQMPGPWRARKGNTVVGLPVGRLRDWRESHSPLEGIILDGVELAAYRSTAVARDGRSTYAGHRYGNLSFPSVTAWNQVK